MPNMSEILKKIQRDLACPICGQKFTLEKIKAHKVFNELLIVQAECRNSHITLFITIFRVQQKNQNQPITNDEVLDLHNRLGKFNGDFEKVFKSQEGKNGTN